MVSWKACHLLFVANSRRNCWRNKWNGKSWLCRWRKV